MLTPFWITWLTVERDDQDTEHLLYYHIPDLSQDPLRVLPNLLVTPLINTETDQIILVTLLIGIFGVMMERRLDVTSSFHVIAFFTGFVSLRLYRRKRTRAA